MYHDTSEQLLPSDCGGGAKIWSQASLYGICHGQKGRGTCFLRVLQFFPTSIVPQMLHTHISFIYTTVAVADDSATKTSLPSSM